MFMCHGFCLFKQTKKINMFVDQILLICGVFLYSQYRKCTRYVHYGKPVVKTAHVIVHCKLDIKCNQIQKKSFKCYDVK